MKRFPTELNVPLLPPLSLPRCNVMNVIFVTGSCLIVFVMSLAIIQEHLYIPPFFVRLILPLNLVALATALPGLF
jgi:hypothetical protein